MDGRDKELDLADPPIREVQKLRPYLFIVEISKLIADLMGFYFDSGMGIDGIVFAGITFAKDLVNHFASITTKVFAIKCDWFRSTILTTVITRYMLFI
jgi:hypothetical protein